MDVNYTNFQSEPKRGLTLTSIIKNGMETKVSDNGNSDQ